MKRQERTCTWRQLKYKTLEKTFGIRTIFKKRILRVKARWTTGSYRGKRSRENDAHKMSHWRRRLHGRSRYRSLRWNYRLFKTRCDLYRWGNLRRNDRHGLVDLHDTETSLRETEKAMQMSPNDEELQMRYARLQERFEMLGGFSYEATTRKIIAGLGFGQDDLNRPFQSFFRRTKNAYQLSQSLGTSSFVSHFGRTDQSLGHWHVGMARDLSTFLWRCYSHRFSWSIFPG